MLTFAVSMPIFIVGIYRLNWFEKFLKPIYVEYKTANAKLSFLSALCALQRPFFKIQTNGID